MSVRAGWLSAALLVAAVAPAATQQWLMLEGIADGEMWATDSESFQLSRNGGNPAPAGRVQLFVGLDARWVQAIFMGEIEGGKGSEEGETEVDYDQLIVRFLPSPLAVVDVGKFPTPLGAFANRRLSTMNPLIGAPDGYPVQYPWGATLSGIAGRFDYRAAVVSLPATHEDYVPDPSPAARPVLGAGFTPIPELRIGASVTWGPYLNDTLAAVLPPGADWKSYSQRVLGFDTRISRGYFEFHGELALSRYDVPTHTDAADGVNYYAEVKQTWTPRFFTALRVERNDYPFIRPVTATNWIVRSADGYNAEIGIGVRAARGALVKASYRRLWWKADPSAPQTPPDGYAFAIQASWHFDVKDWIDRKH
jgi:hypothetical protein